MTSDSVFSNTVLAGKVALITGGHSGIGFEISTQFGKHGAKVALMGRRKQILEDAVVSLQKQGIQAIAIAGDVRKKEDSERVVQAVVNEWGRLDILVNGAAGNFLVSPEDLSVNGFRTVLDIDTVGTFAMSLAAQPYLKLGGQGKQSFESGCIINISATLHYTAGWYQIHVSAAKAAIDSLTKSLALEWGTDFKIRVNAIAPGSIVETPGLTKLLPDESVDVKDLNPLGIAGGKHDIAMAAIYLASDAAKWVNGTVLVVDGGEWLQQTPRMDKTFVREFSRAFEEKARSTMSKL